MQRFLYLIFIVLLSSCEGEFKNKTHAKNEVNKQGFRDGRWVDYFDRNDDVLSDTIKGYNYYSLSEYDNGFLIGDIKSFYPNGGLFAKYETYPEQKNQVEKIKRPGDWNIKKQTIYSENETIVKELNYNSKNQLTSKIDYNVRGGIVSKSYSSYFNNGLIKTVVDTLYGRFNNKLNRQDNYLYSLKEMNKVDMLRFEIVYLETSNYDKITKNTTKFIIKEFKEIATIPIKNRIFSEKNIKDLPFRLNYLILSNKKSNDTLYIKKTIEQIRNSQKSNSISQLKSCAYCGRSFNMLTGYVQGLQQNCAAQYSLALENIKLAKRAGYPVQSLKILQADYARGRFYCSVRCVQYSGISFCAM